MVHNINACFKQYPPPWASDIPVEEYLGVFTLAAFDLKERLGLDHIGPIKLAELERVTWANSCLGYNQPDVACAEVIVPGFRMVLEAKGEQYTYHTSSARSEVFSDRVVFVGQTLETGDSKTTSDLDFSEVPEVTPIGRPVTE